MNAQQNHLDLRVENIQYFPEQRCPLCSAPAATSKRGDWYVSYKDYFGSALGNWETYIGYVYFACECEHKPGRGMRVARRGDALIPLNFSDREMAQLRHVPPSIFIFKAAHDTFEPVTSGHTRSLYFHPHRNSITE